MRIATRYCMLFDQVWVAVLSLKAKLKVVYWIASVSVDTCAVRDRVCMQRPSRSDGLRAAFRSCSRRIARGVGTNAAATTARERKRACQWIKLSQCSSARETCETSAADAFRGGKVGQTKGR